VRRKRNVIVKGTPTDFAVCGYCRVVASIESRPFSHILFLSEAFFPEDQHIQFE